MPDMLAPLLAATCRGTTAVALHWPWLCISHTLAGGAPAAAPRSEPALVPGTGIAVKLAGTHMGAGAGP
jgi:hypothetical protein